MFISRCDDSSLMMLNLADSNEVPNKIANWRLKSFQMSAINCLLSVWREGLGRDILDGLLGFGCAILNRNLNKAHHLRSLT